MTKEKDVPGILIKREKIGHDQVYLPGRGLRKRTTGKTIFQQAAAEARRLYAQAQMLSSSPQDSWILSKTIIREIERITQTISESRAWCVGICREHFLHWAGDIALEKINTEMLARYQALRASCNKINQCR